MGDGTNDGAIEPGWQEDPTGRFSHRYHDGESWTEHVSTGGVTSSDPLQAPPGMSALPPAQGRPVLTAATVSVPGTAAVVALSDSPEELKRRRLHGTVLLACCAVVGVSLLLPWIGGAAEYSDGPPRSLTGMNFGGGTAAGFLIVFVALYGWQTFARPRVRYSIAAACVLAFSLGITIFSPTDVGDSELAELGVLGSRTGDTFEADTPFGEIGFRVGIGTGDDSPFANADRVTPESGLYLAALAQVVAIVPVAVLWKDDRRRRREAGVIL